MACCMSFRHVAEVHGMLQGIYSMLYGCGDMCHVWVVAMSRVHGVPIACCRGM